MTETPTRVKEETGEIQELEVKHLLTIPSKDGDMRYEWDPNNADQVASVRAAYNEARGRGMAAFRMQPGGGRGEQITEFDPSAEAILMAPQMVGG